MWLSGSSVFSIMQSYANVLNAMQDSNSATPAAAPTGAGSSQGEEVAVQPLAASVSYTSVPLTCLFSRMLRWTLKMCRAPSSNSPADICHLTLPSRLWSIHMCLFKARHVAVLLDSWRSPSSHGCSV